MAEALTARIEFRIHTQAKRSRIAGMIGTVYKLDVAAPAIDGRANSACIAFLSELTGIGRRDIQLVRGGRSRSKVFAFDGVGVEDLRVRLERGL